MLGEGVQQFQVFVVFAVLGLALCSVYLFGMGLFRGRLATIIFDCIFGACSVYAVFATNLATNNGEFRLFIFIALAFGCILSVFTCKTLLDKVSSALYNLFTIVEDEQDATLISQQSKVGINSGGGSAGAASDLYAANNVVADVGSQTKRGKAASGNRRAARKRGRTQQHSGIYARRRVRKAVGRK